MGAIILRNMRFYAQHGCFEQERTIGTNFNVDLRLKVDTSQAEVSDNISDTVSYLDVYQVVKREMGIASNLLEHVARRIGEAILYEFPMVEGIQITISKLNPPLGGQIGAAVVEINLERN